MVSTLIGMRFPTGTNQQVRKSIPFQRFLIALSVRPGMSFAISVQRDPSVAYARKMTVSSCSVHASWRMAGSSWLHLMREVIRGHQRSSEVIKGQSPPMFAPDGGGPQSTISFES